MASADVLASVTPSLLPLGRTLVGPGDAEDLVQQAALEFLASRSKRKHATSIRRWLERRMTLLAEDLEWDRDHAPETLSYEGLGGQ